MFNKFDIIAKLIMSTQTVVDDLASMNYILAKRGKGETIQNVFFSDGDFARFYDWIARAKSTNPGDGDPNRLTLCRTALKEEIRQLRDENFREDRLEREAATILWHNLLGGITVQG